jgi:hypothetical protein
VVDWGLQISGSGREAVRNSRIRAPACDVKFADFTEKLRAQLQSMIPLGIPSSIDTSSQMFKANEGFTAATNACGLLQHRRWKLLLAQVQEDHETQERSQLNDNSSTGVRTATHQGKTAETCGVE